MTLLYEDGRQGEVNLIASRDSIVHLGNVDFENLTVNLKPKAVAAGEKAVGLGTTKAPFGDLYLQGNTLTISTKSVGITEISGTEYLNFGSNVMIGTSVITGDRLLAFQDELNTSSLTDVNIVGIADDNCIQWDADTSKWVDAEYTQPEDLDLSASPITELLDIQPDSYQAGQMWQYSPSVGKWKAFNSNALEWTDFKATGSFTVNSEAVWTTTRTIQINAGEVVCDSFSINTYNSAKYFISCEDYTTDNKGYWGAQVTLVHDGVSDTSFSVYSEVELGSISMFPGIAADVSGGNVRLKITTTSDQQVVTSHRTSITKYTS